MACNPDMSVATSPDNGLDAEDMVGPKCSCGPPRCGASNPGADLWERDGGKEASEAVLPPLINPLAIIVWKSANNKGHAIDGKLPSWSLLSEWPRKQQHLWTQRLMVDGPWRSSRFGSAKRAGFHSVPVRGHGRRDRPDVRLFCVGWWWCSVISSASQMISWDFEMLQ